MNSSRLVLASSSQCSIQDHQIVTIQFREFYFYIIRDRDGKSVDGRHWSAPRELESFRHRLSTGRQQVSCLRERSGFKFGRRDVADRRMKALPVIDFFEKKRKPFDYILVRFVVPEMHTVLVL